MRIVHVVPNLGIGGAETMIVDLAAAQLENGDMPVVIALWPREGNHLDERLVDLGIPVHYLCKRKGLDIGCVSDLRKVLRLCRPDVIHTHRDSLPYVLLADSRARTRLIHTVHNLPAREAQRAVSRLVRTVAFRLGRAVPVALSPSLSDEVCNYYGVSTCHVVSNGIPFFSSQPAGIMRRGRLVYVGRLSHDKHPELALRVLQVLKSRGMNVSLDLYGEGPLRAPLEELATSFGIEDSLHVLGIHPNLRAVLPTYDIFLNTSRLEGMPISIIEAMAGGVPVVASAVGGVPEMLGAGEFGCLVESDDPNAYAEAILGLLHNSVLYEAIRDGATRFAGERFGASLMADAYREIYLA